MLYKKPHPETTTLDLSALARKRTKEHPHANVLFSGEPFQRLNPSRTHLCHPGTVTRSLTPPPTRHHPQSGTHMQEHQRHQQGRGQDGAGWSQLVPANTFHCTLMTAGPPAPVTLALTPLHGPPGILQGQEG